MSDEQKNLQTITQSNWRKRFLNNTKPTWKTRFDMPNYFGKNLVKTLVATTLLTVFGAQMVKAQDNTTVNENTGGIEALVPEYQLDTANNPFPVDLTGYGGMDPADINLANIVDAYRTEADRLSEGVNSMDNSLENRFEITRYQKFSLKSTQPDSMGNMYLTHNPRNNSQVTLSMAANAIGVEEKNLPQFAVDFLATQGIEVTKDEIVYEARDGEYIDISVADRPDIMGRAVKRGNRQTVRATGTDITAETFVTDSTKAVITVDDHNNVYIDRGTWTVIGRDAHIGRNGHINVLSGDEIPFTSEYFERDFDQMDASADLADDYRIAADQLESLLIDMNSLRREIEGTYSDADSTVTLNEIVNINSSVVNLNIKYDLMNEDLQELLRPVEYQTLVAAYTDLSGDVQKFFDELNNKIATPETSEESVEGDRSGINLDAGVQMIFRDDNFLTLGAGYKFKTGTSLNVGVLGHYSNKQTEGEEVIVPLPDGSHHYGMEWFDETRESIGAYFSVKQDLVDRYLEAGAKYLFVPMQTDIVRTKLEAQRNIPGTGGEKSKTTTERYTSNSIEHLIGAELTATIPIGEHFEFNATPGIFYNLTTKEFQPGAHVGFSVNLGK